MIVYATRYALPVRITTGFGTEYRKDDAEEESHQSQTHNRHDSSLTDVTLTGCSFRH